MLALILLSGVEPLSILVLSFQFPLAVWPAPAISATLIGICAVFQHLVISLTWY